MLHPITLNDTHTLGKTPLDEASVHRRDLYLTTQTFRRDKHLCPWQDSNPQPQQSELSYAHALTARQLGSAFKHYYGYEMEGKDWRGIWHAWVRSAYRILVVKPKRNTPFGRPRRRLDDIFNMELTELGL